MSSSDGLVLSDALLLQARLRKPEKYGKGRYCFRKNSECPSIYIALRERATKNHLGGLRDNEDNLQTVM